MDGSPRHRRRGARRAACVRQALSAYLRRGAARPRRCRVHRARTPSPARAEHLDRRRARPGCISPTSPTTRRGRPARSPSTCASSASPLSQDVVTSAQAAARVLAEQLPAGRQGVRHRRHGLVRGPRGRRASCRCRTSTRSRSRSSPATTPTALAHRHRRRDPGAPRAALGGFQHRRTVPTAARSAVRATACWSRPSPATRAGSRSWPGKPEPPLFEETLRAGAAASGRWWSGTGWTPTSRERSEAGFDSLLVMTGVTGLRELVAAAPGAAADVPRRGPGRACAAPTRVPVDGAGGSWRAGAPGCEDGALRGRPVTGAVTTGGGRSPRPPGGTSTGPGSLSTSPELAAPGSVGRSRNTDEWRSAVVSEAASRGRRRRSSRRGNGHPVSTRCSRRWTRSTGCRGRAVPVFEAAHERLARGAGRRRRHRRQPA